MVNLQPDHHYPTTFTNSTTHPTTLIIHPSSGRWGERHARLSASLGRVLEDYSLVKFFPLDITSEENVQDLLMVVDNTIQYGEDADVKTRDFDAPEGEFDAENMLEGGEG